MAEANEKLIKTINLLREDNSIFAEQNLKQQKDTEDGIKSLGKTMSEVLAAIRGDALQQEEDRREKKKEGAAKGKSAAGKPIQGDITGLGSIFGVLSGIVAASTGFIAGALEGVFRGVRTILTSIRSGFNLVAKLFKDGFKRFTSTKIVQSLLKNTVGRITKYFDDIGKAFRMGIDDTRATFKDFKGKFRKMTSLETFFKDIGTTFREVRRAAVQNFIDPFRKLAGNIGRYFDDIGKAFRIGLGDSSLRLTEASGKFRKATNIEGLAKMLGSVSARISSGIESAKNFFGKIGSGFTKLTSVFKEGTILKSISAANKDVGRFVEDGKQLATRFKDIFGMIGKNFDSVGKFFSGIKNAVGGFLKGFSGIFSAFKVLGRFIAFPITIITGIIDGVTGFMEGFKRQEGIFNSLLGGAIGAIGGIIGGLVGGLLDLVKSGVSWIASKLGFENFSEMLDSFDFTTEIKKIFNSVADGIIAAKDYIIGIFTGENNPISDLFVAVDDFVIKLKEWFVSLIPSMDDIKAIATKGLSAVKSFFGGEEEAPPPPAPSPAPQQAPTTPPPGAVPTAAPVAVDPEKQERVDHLKMRRLRIKLERDPKDEELAKEFRVLASQIRRREDPTIVSRKIEREQEKVEGILKTRTAPEKPPLTAAEFQTANMNQVQRENKEATAAATTAVNFAPVNQNTTNVNNNSTTAAIMTPNMPTVDNLDRSWGN